MSRVMNTCPGITLREFGYGLHIPTVAHAYGWFAIPISLTRWIIFAAPRSASCMGATTQWTLSGGGPTMATVTLQPKKGVGLGVGLVLRAAWRSSVISPHFRPLLPRGLPGSTSLPCGFASGLVQHDSQLQ